MTENGLSAADIAAVTGNNNGGGMFGGNNDWGWIIILLLFGWGGRGFGGGFGGYGGGYGASAPCATQADVRAAVDQQTLISKLDQQTYGIADLGYSLTNEFRGIDRAVCNLGYQQAQCCCDTRAAIKDVGTDVERAGWNLSKQISDCCCDIEKMNMQNRFDAQGYNCNTLQAIDKLGDRIIGYMTEEKTQALRDENMALRLAASQARQNQYLINELRPCPVPAYITCNPYAASYGFGGGGCAG
jgi:hypothetical protein